MIFAAKIEPLFTGMGIGGKVRAFWVPMEVAESNVWGTKIGRGAFTTYARKILETFEYANKPKEPLYACMEDRDQVDVEWWENITKCDKISKITDVETIDPIVNVKICDNLSHFKVAELTSGSVDAAVLLGTALDLSYIKDGEVDLVVTDPPYYSNIQYGELSDFYYVWLRLFLHERYPDAFGLEPEQLKPQEIVVNPKKGKDEKFFVEMLTAALREAYRVLRKDGILVMTYHHSEEARAHA